jgi:hypothetical protein
MILHPYFKLKGIEPGRVVTARFGVIDFRLPASFEILKSLFDDGFPYLKLTTEGKNALLNKHEADLFVTAPLDGTIIPIAKKAVSKLNNKNNAGKSK